MPSYTGSLQMFAATGVGQAQPGQPGIPAIIAASQGVHWQEAQSEAEWLGVQPRHYDYGMWVSQAVA